MKEDIRELIETFKKIFKIEVINSYINISNNNNNEFKENRGLTIEEWNLNNKILEIIKNEILNTIDSLNYKSITVLTEEDINNTKDSNK